MSSQLSSFYEVTLHKMNRNECDDTDSKCVLSLAPFSPVPHLEFLHVKIGTSLVQYIFIQNPTQNDLKIMLIPPKDFEHRGFNFNHTTVFLPKTSEFPIEIEWIPREFGQWRDTIHVKQVEGAKKFGHIIITSSVEPPKKIHRQKKVRSMKTSLHPSRQKSFISVKPEDLVKQTELTVQLRRETYEIPATATTYHFSQIPNCNLSPLNKCLEIKEEIDSPTKHLQKENHNSYMVNVSLDRESDNNQLHYLNVSDVIPEKINSTNYKSKATQYVMSELLDCTNVTERNCCTTFSVSLTPKKPCLTNNIERVTRSLIGNEKSFRNELDEKKVFDLLNLDDTISRMGHNSFDADSNLLSKDDERQKSNNNLTNLSEGMFTSHNFNCLKNIENIIHYKDKKSSEIEFNRDFKMSKYHSTPLKVEQKNDKISESVIVEVPIENHDFLKPLNNILNNNECNKDLNNTEYTINIHELDRSCESYSARKENNFLKGRNSSIQKKRPHLQSNLDISALSTKSLTRFKKTPPPKEHNRKLLNFKGSKDFLELSKFHNEALTNSVLSHEEVFRQPSYKLDQHGTTTVKNPFTKNALHPKDWLENYALELIKWINSVLTPPDTLNESNSDFDLAKLWKKAIASDCLLLAPTKEKVSSQYHKNEQHLLSLRKAAINMFRSENIGKVLYGINAKIQNGYFCVKDDLDLYCDQGMRYRLVQLIMYYNPLWLRIGLEAVYAQPIHVAPNNIVASLIIFLKNNFLSDKTLVEKHSYSKIQHIKMPAFRKEMNNFIVFKFLTLVFFLDQAKVKRIIPYDPCLFLKSSPIKTSEGMFNEFIKEFIKCVGHMKRTLLHLGYELNHKQTHLDEFDFAVTSHNDLRDGVRLTRAMEIILKDTSLCSKLRTPAVSRLQKIHNVKIALSSLVDQQFVIEDIIPTDVVDGHKEKIMSLLWQILHKFLAPRYEFAARCIQLWWKKTLLKRIINQRISRKRLLAYSKVVIIIQSWWRGTRCRLLLPQIKEILINEKRIRQLAAKTIQNWFRLKVVVLIKNNLRSKSATKIQKWYRGISVMKKERLHFVKVKQSTLTIENWYLSSKETRKQRQSFLSLKNTVVLLQKLYRRNIELKHKRLLIEKQTSAAIIIQTWYKSIILGKTKRNQYLRLLMATLIIQRHFRSKLEMKKERANFLKTTIAISKIKQWYKNIKEMQRQKQAYKEMRNAIITIQIRYRALRLMRHYKEMFCKQLNAIITIQRWYRGVLTMRKERLHFVKVKQSILTIENWYLSSKETRKQRQSFLSLKNTVILLQKCYRRNIVLKHKRLLIEKNTAAAITIQKWYKSIILGKTMRNKYLRLLMATSVIQKHFRSKLEMKKERANFLKTTFAINKMQRWYKNIKEMQRQKQAYKEMRNAIITIQIRYRAVLAMRKERLHFVKVKQSTLTIENWYLSTKETKKQRQSFLSLKNTVILLQKCYRRNIVLKHKRLLIEKNTAAAITIQKWYKSIILGKAMRNKYLRLLMATSVIQRHFRSKLEMKKERANVLKTTIAINKMQCWYKNIKEMQRQKQAYKEMRNAIITIQIRYRAVLAMRKERLHFVKVKQSTLTIENWYLSTKETKKQRQSFLSLKNTVILLQKCYRRNIVLKHKRFLIEKQTLAAITIQKWYKSIILGKTMRNKYLRLLMATLVIQRQFRSKLEMKEVRANYLKTTIAINKMQCWYKNIKEMQRQKQAYKEIRNAIIIIQIRYRAILAMRKERLHFIKVKQSTLTIENWYLNTKERRKQRQLFLPMKDGAILLQEEKIHENKSAILIQNWYRGIMKIRKLQKEQELAHTTLNKGAVVIQAFWRGYKSRKMHKIIPKVKSANWSSIEEKGVVLSDRFHSTITNLSRSSCFNVTWVEFKNLEYITQYSSVLCIELVKFKQFYWIVWNTLDVESRSEPYQEIFTHGINIFLNLSRYKETLPSVWENLMSYSGHNILLNLMVKFYKTNPKLFCKIATLLWVLIQTPAKAQIIRSSSNALKVLKFCYNKLIKGKSNIPKRPVLPYLNSKWGYKKTQEFICSKTAVIELCNMLCIKL